MFASAVPWDTCNDAKQCMSNNRLFTGTACYYAKYRAGYPQEFFDFVIKTFELKGDGRLLDAGCGTGQIAFPLAQHVAEVVALDPEEEMLAEAKRQAKQAGALNISYVQRKAEDISADLGTFRLTTMGASFHWMEQAVVLQKIYAVTERRGGVVIVSDSSSPWRDADAERWKEVRKELVQKYLGEQRRAGDRHYTKPQESFEDQLNESPFGRYEEWTHDYERTWSLEAAINFLYSTSFASRRLFGDRLEAFENELREALLALEPAGVFKEQVRVQALFARKA